jgi:rhamnosyltransferase
MTEAALRGASGAAAPIQLGELAAILVLYSVTSDPSAALRAAAEVAKHVVLVDNAPSGHPAAEVWRSHGGVTVLHNANRGGLAGAYNTALGWLSIHAPETKHVAFIDDDSDASVLMSFLRNVETRTVLALPDTAAVAPAHRDRATGLRAAHLRLTRWGWRQLPREQRGLYRVSFVINSMSVWRRAALDRIGRYDEWLGVDHVDTEYCLRARRLGLKVYVHGDHEFMHSIGRRVAYRFLGRDVQSGGHPAWRRRSIARATAWLGLRHMLREPAFAVLCAMRLGYEALGIALAETARAPKIAALATGTVEGLWHGVLLLARWKR